MPIYTGEANLDPELPDYSKLKTGWGEMLGASAQAGFEEWPSVKAVGVDELARAKGEKPPVETTLQTLEQSFPTAFKPLFGAAQAALRLGEETFGTGERRKPLSAEIPMEEAKNRVREAGLEKMLKLGDAPAIRERALEIMIERAKHRAELDDVISRGPSGFISSAASLGTSFLVGAIDPLNIASAFIPVVGELRYAKLMAEAGESMFSRAVTRAGIGGFQGAVFTAPFVPFDWYAATQEGRDYTMTHAMHSLVLGAGMFAGLHIGGGLGADLYRGYRGRPSYPFGPEDPMSGMSRGDYGLIRQAPGNLIDQVLDLPPQAREDLMRASFASMLRGDPIKAGEMLRMAGERDPRIAESLWGFYDTTEVPDYHVPQHFVGWRTTVEAHPEYAEMARAHPLVALEIEAAQEARNVPMFSLGRLDQLGEDQLDFFLPAPPKREPTERKIKALDRKVAKAGGYIDLGHLELDPNVPLGQQAQLRIVERGRATGVEHLVAIDAEGKVVAYGHGDSGSVSLSDTLVERLKDPNQRIVVHHNHPNDSAFSQQDIFMLGRPGLASLWAHGHNGSAAWVALTPEARARLSAGVAEEAARTGTDAADIPILRLARVYKATYLHVREQMVDRMQILKRQTEAEGRVLTPEDPLVKEAGRQLSNIVSLILRDAGLLEYQANFNANRVVAILGLQSKIDEATRVVRESFYGTAAAAPRPDRPTGPVRNKGDLGAVFAQAEGLTPEHLGALGADRAGGGRAGADVLREDVEDLGRRLSPWNYSAVERAILSIRQDRGTAEQWLGTIRNAKGVKAEELEWLGLEDWLKGQKGPVTKQQISEYIRANQIEVREVEHGSYEEQAAAMARRIQKINAEYETMRMRPETPEMVPRYRELADERTRLLREREVLLNDRVPRYADYQLPGGESYRELLLTLPAKDPDKLPADWTIRREPDEGWYVYNTEGEAVASGITREAAVSNALFEIGNRSARTEGRTVGEFHGSHWDEPNVLAHIRFNDRMVDGKRTLFVEEVQSDWHQKGRKYGYKDDTPRRSKDGIDADLDAIYVELERRYPQIDIDIAGAWDANPDLARRRADLMRERNEVFDREGAVPDAPFKTTWPELTLKRMIRYAAEHGYDSVAWTPGEVQAKRYDLRTVLDRIEYVKEGDQYRVRAFAKDDPEAILPDAPQMFASVAEIEKTFGKDVAQKIERGEGEAPAKATRFNQGNMVLRGENLAIGGEAMTAFYDRELVNKANAIGKKYGAKVERKEIPGDGRDRGWVSGEQAMTDLGIPADRQAVHWASLSQAERDAFIEQYRDRNVGVPNGTVMPQEGGGWKIQWDNGTFSGGYGSQRNAEEALQARIDKIKSQAAQPVHVLPLTPQLREVALNEGFPLFSLHEALTPEAYRRREEIERLLTQVVRHVAGEHAAEVKFPDKLTFRIGPEHGYGKAYEGTTTAAGLFDPNTRIIMLALADPRFRRPMSTAFHESFHALENTALNAREMAALSAAEPRLRDLVREHWQLTGDQAEGLSGAEIRAMAFEMYANARSAGDAAPVGGVIAQIWDKLIELLDRIRTALKGAGFQRAEDIFSEAYEGSLARRELLVPEWRREQQTKLLEPQDPEEQRISTRLPTAVKATEDPMARERLTIGLEEMKRDPQVYETNVGAIKHLLPENMREGTTDEIAERFIDLVKDNLRWLYDQVPEAIRQRSKLWYEGGRAIVDRWSKEYSHDPKALAAVIAAMSPQKDWFENVDMARRLLDVYNNKQSFRYSSAMEEKAKVIFADPKFKPGLDAIRGKTFAELDSETQKLERAMWARLYSQTYHEPHYPIVTPEGDFGALKASEAGKPYNIRWGTLKFLSNAIEALDAKGDIQKITYILGERHKVRNFYNNIIAPNSLAGDVTIDTHAVAAAMLRPYSGASKEVGHVLATEPGVASSAITGVAGNYGLYAEAYRRLARELGILPRELQSITWEAVRGLFPAPWKRPKNIAAVEAVWQKYLKGDMSAAAVRKEINDLAGGINAPGWYRSDLGLHAAAPDPAHAGELSPAGLSGGSPGGMDLGRRGGAAEGIAGRSAGWSSEFAEPPAVGSRLHFSLGPPEPKHDLTWGELFERLSDTLGSRLEAARALKEAGIPGLRYNTRAGAERYVLFDDALTAASPPMRPAPREAPTAPPAATPTQQAPQPAPEAPAAPQARPVAERPPDRDWHELAAREYEDPELVAASKTAEKVPDPVETKPITERISAAEKAEAEADEMYKLVEPHLTDEERQAVTTALHYAEMNAQDEGVIFQRGAACLFAAGAGAAA